MKKLLLFALALALAAGGVTLWANNQDQPGIKKTQPGQPNKLDKTRDETAVLEAIFSYQEALNRGDADGLAKMFTEDAEFTDDKGKTVFGREAIRKDLAARIQRQPDAKTEINIEWFRWLAADVLSEHGNTKTTLPSGDEIRFSYSAIHVKRDGQWRLATVRQTSYREKAAQERENNLRDLDWLIGDWVDEDDSGTLKITGKWSQNKAYVIRSFKVTTKEGTPLEGTEIIGWDPAREQLRSWVFDSNGGFSEGVWTQKGKQWYCKLHGVQSDGKRASAVHVFNPQGDHYTFQSLSRTLDGVVQPDITDVTVKRASKANQ